MGFDRRLLTLLLVLAVLGVPAAVLRVLCVGHACDQPVEASAEVPFCSLPEAVRSLVAAGFREGRSPEILGVTAGATVTGGAPGARTVAWPSVDTTPPRVPLAFLGGGIVNEGEGLPPAVGLDDVAPTIARLMGIERPHPEVRSGQAIVNVAPSEPVPLVVEIVWKGVGSAELEEDREAWPRLATRMGTGLATLDATVPSVPVDPAAVLATIGAGGVPAQHGVTGSLVRNDAGKPVRPWSRNAPVVVIAALGDDLDELTEQRARVGLIAADPADRGLIGAEWYADTDRDDVAGARRGNEVVSLVRNWTDKGYGRDGVPDLLAVTLTGTVEDMDRTTDAIAATVADRSPEAAVVVTATGSTAPDPDLRAGEVVRQVEQALGSEQPAVSAAVAGGLFLDQDVVAEEAISEDDVLAALQGINGPGGEAVFSDVFPAIAVSFGRYC